MIVSRFARKLLLLIALLAQGLMCWAEPIRISSWSFQSPATTADTASVTNDSQIELAAKALSPLDPDIILLQGVRDWRMCQQLAQALGVYKVLGCSSFTTASGTETFVRQVAILSKHKSYFFWSDT